MTDTYAEEILITHFKKIEILTKVETTDFEGNTIYEYPEIALPNESFERPDDGYWYELHPIPAKSMDIELGTKARSRWIGILQVNICVPKNSGSTPLNERYDEIAKHFRRGLVIDGVRIISSDRTSAMDDGDYYVMPVSIVWQADLDR